MYLQWVHMHSRRSQSYFTSLLFEKYESFVSHHRFPSNYSHEWTTNFETSSNFVSVLGLKILQKQCKSNERTNGRNEMRIWKYFKPIHIFLFLSVANILTGVKIALCIPNNFNDSYNIYELIKNSWNFFRIRFCLLSLLSLKFRINCLFSLNDVCKYLVNSIQYL